MQESDYKICNRGGWCSKRTRLEKILITTLVITAIIICIVLLVLGTKKETEIMEINSICSTQTCKYEASKILNFMDLAVNPCENFYMFACGNHFTQKATQEYYRQIEYGILIDIFMEPILYKDHKMVKMAKKLFKACMNKTEVEMDGVKTIKNVLESIGVGPVIEGANWNEENFDWLEVTYKLRKLGYEFKIFLDLAVVRDPTNRSKSILKVSLPFPHQLELMTDTPSEFGAQFGGSLTDNNDAIKFVNQLKAKVLEIGQSKAYPIEVYQDLCSMVNWLELINNITGTTTKLSKTDLAIFPPPELMTNWLTIISSTPKRTQANYMMGRVIKASLPFLSISRQKLISDPGLCLEEVQKRFTPSPIDVLFLRKYLPQHKKKAVEEVFSNIKEEFVANFKKHVNWIDAENKVTVLERFKTVELGIGIPEDYMSDQVLDDLNVDMIIPKNDNLLNLIAQANRNHQTVLYNYVTNHKGRKAPKEDWKELKMFPYYLPDDNVIVVSPISIKEAILFNENGSNYLNYGSLGSRIAFEMAGILTLPLVSTTYNWYDLTKAGTEERIQCIKDAAVVYKLPEAPDGLYYSTNMAKNNAGVKIAYKTYRNWVINHGEEKQLIGIDYTPNQLFWVSSVSPYCSPVNHFCLTKNPLVESLMDSIKIVPEFSQDFNCSNEVEMTASTKCELF